MSLVSLSWFAILLLCVVFLEVYSLSEPAKKTTHQPFFKLDFAPFTTAIEIAVQKTAQFAELTSNSTNMDCAMPRSSIMFTYANHETMELVLLQHQAMEIWGLRSCLESRFIVACMDAACHKLCTQQKVANCVLMGAELVTPTSDFERFLKHYLNSDEVSNYISFLKHYFMYYALNVVDEVFFFDANVILFRNPWIATSRTGEGSSVTTKDKMNENHDTKADLMCQSDHKHGNNCDGAFNEGQLYTRNSAKMEKYFETLFSNRDEIVKGKGLNDNYIAGAAREAQLVTSTFPVNELTTHCGIGEANCIDQKTKIHNFVSYNLACVDGEVKDKKVKGQYMMEGIREKNKNKHNTIGNYVCKNKKACKSVGHA